MPRIEAWHGSSDRRPSTGLALSPAYFDNELLRDARTPFEMVKRHAPATTIAERVLEKRIGKDTNVSISVLNTIAARARAVCQVRARNGGVGTGFLVRDDLLMTNNHVFAKDDKSLATPKDAAGSVAVFNFEQDLNGKFRQPEQYDTQPESFFTADLDLDFAIVGLSGRPGRRWGTLPLADNPVELRVGDDVFIIQHAGGGPKQISLAGNEIEYVDDRVIQYTTDTLEGSSGAPVFDYKWRLVAIHHAGGDIDEPATRDRYFRNEGILMKAITETILLPPR